VTFVCATLTGNLEQNKGQAMNEILYADSDTNQFKAIKGKVWVMAEQRIYQPSGSTKQASLSSALRTAVRFKYQKLKIKRKTIRFTKFKSPRPNMVQTDVQAFKPVSLSTALKKAILRKTSKSAKTAQVKIIEGAIVWTLTSNAIIEMPENHYLSPFSKALKCLKKENQLTKDEVENTDSVDEPHLSVLLHLTNTHSAMQISA
jgi:hypothetical protein